jgi:exodeoxyribonuclease V alpha subunit
VRAKSIIDTFGISKLDVLDQQPERLKEVTGIGPKSFEKIKIAWEKQKHLRSLMIFLQGYGVSLNYIMKIYKTYGIDAQKKICENPYSLVEDVWGIGFIKADQIAQKMGFTHDSYKRIRAGLVFIMQEGTGNGHVYLAYDEIVQKASEILEVEKEPTTFSLDHAIEAKLFMKEENCIYLPAYFYAEKYVAEDFKKRVHYKTDQYDKEKVDTWLKLYQQNKSWKADPLQIEAVECALMNSIFILTGGPGTGKTTILQMIVAFFKEHDKKVLLAAPTGRAAQRMGNVANLSAQTIHRLLEFKPSQNGFTFAKNENNQLDADVIIIDEVSMMDLLLMRNLLLSIKDQTILILVGDNNQLPSVGAGNVLADLIHSNTVPHVNLTTIFRQAAQSRIVTAAHEIIRGLVPEFANSTEDDCFFITKEDPQICQDTIVDLVANRLPKKYKFEPINDIQVLSPMHNGLLGTDLLNTCLQKKLNENPIMMTKGNKVFFLGDKVMQIRNNYDQGVFNGDIGNVIDIIKEEHLIVAYDNKRIQYEFKDLEEIQPAYCISIHKSQGCEFKAVIIPVTTQHFIMLQRNLIYTALTRAKKMCIMVGTKKALSIAVKNNDALQRNSRLADLIKMGQ